MSTLFLAALALSTLACGASPAPPPATTPAAAPARCTFTEDLASIPADAQRTPSGLVTRVMSPGTGTIHPGPSDRVTVNYTGWTSRDGKTFDSSISHGKPASFSANRVIPGWTEGLQLMVVGEKRRMWIPSKLAYGDSPTVPGAPSGDLTFDVELLDIKAVPPVPPDVAAPPASATRTGSGLAYEVLTAAADPNAPRPNVASKVTVNYTGWTTDGNMFDSSMLRGKPAVFPLRGVIAGWSEGLLLMRVGETTRFWIPGELAYDDPARVPRRPGAPHGMLVIDVELLGFE